MGGSVLEVKGACDAGDGMGLYIAEGCINGRCFTTEWDLVGGERSGCDTGICATSGRVMVGGVMNDCVTGGCVTDGCVTGGCMSGGGAAGGCVSGAGGVDVDSGDFGLSQSIHSPSHERHTVCWWP